ncbi:helix-turn-helix domain-containing protein [Alicyclobacillus tolerans]|uniref:helix-turn-helix domain-containing protein n=1 Tax=Alicyclobacillus tolerans TaxID=90970 RepID=UPI001F1BB948|nr:helix-turn-helix transcriptional regulator [Alicyclobacillus tolerans]MCF8566181.1 helix-turn-helix domain-containing protein [Alicyclobacillus tolerans]
MSVGSRLVELRKERGWTQSKLAEMAHLSASAIAMYETNRRTPDPAALGKLSKALGVPKNAFASDSPEVDSLEAGGLNVPSKPAPDAAPAAAPVIPAQVPETHVDEDTAKVTTLALTREEARVILFLRMHPECTGFMESYVLASASKRKQLEDTLRLLNQFQK